MDFMKEYRKWLTSGVLTAEEQAELEKIKDDPKEIESRFYPNCFFRPDSFKFFICISTAMLIASR